jgi:NAD-dependent dihydropyrimidine dehydrogenase PreA subunit
VALVRSTQGVVDNDNSNDINIANSNIGVSGEQKSKNPDTPEVNPEICTGCGICIENCPIQAIELINGKAFINEAECTNCRLCEPQCSFGAIS